MIAVGIRYLCGHAAATDLSRQRPEWPVHPGRAFLAMAATHYETGSDPAERMALEWLEEAGPPEIRAGRGEARSYVKAYVPVNDDHGNIVQRSRQERAFPKAWLEDDSAYLLWREDPPEIVRNSLTQLCPKVTRIGHSSSLVQMWVYTARTVFERLRRAKCTGCLLIGRMRPLDRDDLMAGLESLRSGVPRDAQCETKFVVSTQCLEVGADLDFDVLASECASIDALQQRFGRLDRLGDFGQARGSIVIGAGQLDTKNTDTVYGEALAQTWTWLNEIAEGGEVDMGIETDVGRPATVGECLKRGW
jgi:CRISPR-associated helicase Cas3